MNDYIHDFLVMGQAVMLTLSFANRLYILFKLFKLILDDKMKNNPKGLYPFQAWDRAFRLYILFRLFILILVDWMEE